MDVSPEIFEKAAAIIGDKNITPARKASYSEKTQLYGLYKRATVGKLNPPYGASILGERNHCFVSPNSSRCLCR